MNSGIEWCFKGVNPLIHKEYRGLYWQKKGTLSKLYTKELPRDVHFLNEVLFNRIELEGDVNLGNYSDICIVRTQNENRDNVLITYKYPRKDLTRLNLRNISLDLVKSLKSYLAGKYGYVYGNSGYIVNMAMNLRLKMEKGTVKVAEKSRKYSENVLSGVVVSPLQEELSEVRKENQTLRTMMEHIIILLSGEKKNIKTNKTQHKLNKAVTVLDEVKKYRESSFTTVDYKTALIQRFGQADHRTIQSDLDALKSTGIIIEDRMVGYKGTMRYKFSENNLYSKYNSPRAMQHFLELFKSEFRGRLQTSKKEVNEFIQRVSGLTDVKSVFKRLEVLLIDGFITSFGASDKIFNVHID